ncbi:MAG: hypothetical protein AAGF99_01660 [Bacteroidota bacterium]
MLVLSLFLAALAYGAFYAAAPGRQSQALGPTRPLLWLGATLTAVALALSVVGTQSAVGPVLVATVMMAAASLLAVVGPFVFPEAVASRKGAAPTAGRPAGAKPVGAKPPGARPPGINPTGAKPPTARPPGVKPPGVTPGSVKPASAKPVGARPPSRPPTRPPAP